MPEQLSFAGFDPPQPPTDRLFFALFPGAEVAAKIGQLALQLRVEHVLHSKPLRPERFHVTLHHLGDHAGVPQDIVAAACDAAATVTIPPFQLAFDRVASFSGKPGNRPLVLRGDDGVVALKAFQQVLGKAMQIAGLGRWAEMRFTPHVTLLYDERLVAEQAVEAITWTAQEFVLVHSLIGQSRHLPLRRWALRDGSTQR